jgi:hypothetical protein
MENQGKIAVLYFSRTAATEGRAKAWFSAAAPERNATLADALILHTDHFLQNSGLPVFHYHEGNQRGNSFGERIANAFQDTFSLGYEAVIAVGNDTPEMSRLDWNRIIEPLRSGQCVLGPTFRRGAYLIGLTAEMFEKTGFLKLPWQSRRLLQALIDFCQTDQDPVILLDTLRDINSCDDLKLLAQSGAVDPALQYLFLLLLFSRAEVHSAQTVFLPKMPRMGSSLFRAPPSLTSSFI